jgi:hypothetical protein
VDAGLLTRKEIGQHLTDLTAGGLDLAAFPVVSAWGRNPGAVAGQPLSRTTQLPSRR